MTKNPMLKFAVALTLAGAAAQAADDSALIDILQRKGVLSKKEAEEVRAEMAHDAGDSASKIKLSPAVSELKLYGDLRLRYQYDSKDNQLLPHDGGGSNVSQQNRWRFRLRVNADFKLGETVFGGVELATGHPADSANQTYDEGFDDYNIFISKAYLGWKPNDWFTLLGGKFTNPFYTTDLVWDPDITPNGATEIIAFHKLFGGGESGGGGYSKDGKAIKEVVAPELPWELTLVAGQFIYDDNKEFAGPDSDLSTDAYLFETQLIGSYKFDSFKITFAPAWLTYINGTLTDLDNNNPFNDPVPGLGATRDLNLLLAPGDVTFKVAGVKTKFFWDFSYNIDGNKRVQDIYGQRFAPGVPQHTTEDDFAYSVGLQIGENKKAGDWSFILNWRATGLGSVDPNLNESDFVQGELNTRGWKVGASYSLTDFSNLTVTYGYAWNLRDSLVGPLVTGSNGVADSNEVQLLQVDLNVKF
jgi:hypothetical protein